MTTPNPHDTAADAVLRPELNQAVLQGYYQLRMGEVLTSDDQFRALPPPPRDSDDPPELIKAFLHHAEWLRQHNRSDPAERLAAEHLCALNDIFAGGERILHFMAGYVEHIARLRLAPPEVVGYMTWSHRTLGSLYVASRQPVHSPQTLRRLVCRYAVDARREPGVNPEVRFVRDETGWSFATVPSTTPALPREVFRAIARPVTKPYGGRLLDHIHGTPIKRDHIVELVERIFGRVPGDADTLEFADVNDFVFLIESGGDRRLRLWIEGREVDQIGGKYEQFLLKHLCRNPETVAPGRRLETSVPGLKNASAAAGKVQAAMGKVLPRSENWLRTDPICWAQGVRPKQIFAPPGK
ncbi:MAG: hypothetical protein JWO38_637 [Gemmataceae bacterium]|nr:hypothetical protein [Gemmataceae bacterium]